MIEVAVLRVVSSSPDVSAAEVAGRVDSTLVGGGAQAVRRVSSALVSLASSGLVIRLAGHKARYSVTERGRATLSRLDSVSLSSVAMRDG